MYEWVLDPDSGAVVSKGCLNPNVMVKFPQIEDASVGRRVDGCYGLALTSISGLFLQFTAPKTGVLLDGVVRLALEDDTTNGVKAGDILGRFDLPAA